MSKEVQLAAAMLTAAQTKMETARMAMEKLQKERQEIRKKSRLLSRTGDGEGEQQENESTADVIDREPPAKKPRK